MRKVSFFILVGIMTGLNIDFINKPIYAHGYNSERKCEEKGYGTCFKQNGKWKHNRCNLKVYPWSKTHKHSSTDGKKKC